MSHEALGRGPILSHCRAPPAWFGPDAFDIMAEPLAAPRSVTDPSAPAGGNRLGRRLPSIGAACSVTDLLRKLLYYGKDFPDISLLSYVRYSLTRGLASLRLAYMTVQRRCSLRLRLRSLRDGPLKRRGG